MTPTLAQLLEQGVFDSLDVALTKRMAQAVGETDADVLLAVTLATRWARDGHSCLDLHTQRELKFSFEQEREIKVQLPPANALLPKLQQSRLCGHGEPLSPWILDDQRLYLRRYAHAEAFVAKRLLEMAAANGKAIANADLLNLLPAAEPGDLQGQALRLALQRRFLLLSGGPGTGKTWLAAKLLTILAEQNGLAKPRVMLLAPTGKAAQRLAQSLRDQAAQLRQPWLDEVAATAQTLHRALGYNAKTSAPLDQQKPLHADWVIVDESSMVDIELMAALLAALPTSCRLLLLGDGRQLAAVAVGSVFADLCAAAALATSPMAGSLVELKKSRRFSDDRGIGALAADIRRIDEGTLLAEVVATKILANGYADVTCLPTSERQLWSQQVQELLMGGYAELQAATSATAALTALTNFRVLAALREGPFGVEQVNHDIAARLEQDPSRRAQRRPLLVTENNAELGLYNGDTGVTFASQGRLLAYFDSLGGRSLSLARLPRHSSAYAMTIHKSQGSEYKNVAVILPWLPESASHPLLSRELLYTAITRAREKVYLIANHAALIATLGRKVDRASGLVDRLT